jgi:DNA-binding NtrC family response regulator
MHDDLGIIGVGVRMHAIREFIRLIARDSAPVLIIGESGTGRHFVGRVIQAQSPTARRITIALPAKPTTGDDVGTFRIVLPPLRERREDIALLTDHFLAQAARTGGRELRPMSPSARHTLAEYAWPANLRELQQTCEWISRTCSCPSVKRGCLPARLHHRFLTPGDTRTPRCVSLDDQLDELEARLIIRALVETNYNRSKAAPLLAVKRSTLGDRIQRLRLVEQIGEEVA